MDDLVTTASALDPETSQPEGRWERLRRSRNAQGVVLGTVVFVIQSVSPTPQIGDSALSTVTAWQFLHHLNLNLAGYRSVRSLGDRYDLVQHGGHVLPFFPWPPMLFMAPADLLYALIGRNPSALAIGSSHGRTWVLEVPTASLLVAITTVLLWRIILRFHGRWGRPRVALAAALIYAFGTSAWSIGSRALWQQTVSMLFLTLSFLALSALERSRRWEWLLGLSLGMALIVRPTNAIPVMLFLGLVALRRRQSIGIVLVGFAIILVPFLIFSHGQYGEFLPPYYRPGRLGAPGPFPFGEALAENLVSPSRGLLVFDPIAFLAVAGLVLRWRHHAVRDLDVLLALAVLGQWVVIATYGSTGGATYGPRLMLDIVPFLVLLAVPAISFALDPSSYVRGAGRAIVAVGLVALVAFGFFVNATGATLRSSVCWNGDPVAVDSRPDRVWSWSDAQFLWAYRNMAHGATITQELTATCAVLDGTGARGSR